VSAWFTLGFEDIEGALEHAARSSDDVKIGFVGALRVARKSVISTNELTFGYLTSPFESATGLSGSCLTRKSELSVATRPSPTTCALSSRSSSERKVTMRRRYGSPPGAVAVESALAMFSEMMRMRPACARIPVAAIAIDLMKSITAGCLRLPLETWPQALPIAVLINARLCV
jgi:hypothetical protein